MALDRKVAKVTLVGVPDRPGIARADLRAARRPGHQRRRDRPERRPRGHDRHVVHGRTRSTSARAERLLEPARRATSASRASTTEPRVAKVSIVGAGIQNSPGYAARMFGALADAGINILMISTSEIRITCIIAEDAPRRGGRGDPPHVPARGAAADHGGGRGCDLVRERLAPIGIRIEGRLERTRDVACADGRTRRRRCGNGFSAPFPIHVTWAGPEDLARRWAARYGLIAGLLTHQTEIRGSISDRSGAHRIRVTSEGIRRAKPRGAGAFGRVRSTPISSR